MLSPKTAKKCDSIQKGHRKKSMKSKVVAKNGCDSNDQWQRFK